MTKEPKELYNGFLFLRTGDKVDSPMVAYTLNLESVNIDCLEEEFEEKIEALKNGKDVTIKLVCNKAEVVSPDRIMEYAYGKQRQPEIVTCEEFPNNSDTISRKERKMTDTEMRRREAICKVAGVSEIDDVSDGFHTFRQLYYQRMMLFAAIVRQNKDKAWKSFRHEDGELCFGGGWFIVGIDTPEGSYTYHYEDNYFSLFDCEELECSKHWDGHTEKDVTRLLTLPSAQPEQRWIPVTERLPEEGKVVLTQAKFKDDVKMAVSSRIDYNYWTTWGTRNINIIAWMPLPEPYQGERKTDE